MSFVYLTIMETAAYADVTRRTVYRWIQSGVRIPPQGGRLQFLTASTVSGHYGVEQGDLDRFLDFLGYEPEADESDEDESDEE